MTSQMLARNPRKRKSADELMEHPYFHGIDWEALERYEYEREPLSSSDSHALADLFGQRITSRRHLSSTPGSEASSLARSTAASTFATRGVCA